MVTRRKSRTIAGSPIKRIPSIDDFSLGEKYLNELLLEVGIKRNLPRNKYYLRNRHNRMNRYLEHQILRARKVGRMGANSFSFGRIAFLTIRYSRSMRLSAFYKVFPRGYYELSIRNAKQILRKTNNIVASMDPLVKFSRVYISKADGSQRPLGVPTPEGRIVSHMGCTGLTEFLREEISEFNHAYMPKLGCLTAGKEVITKILNKKYIYEFDLKSFFENVLPSEISLDLASRGIPLEIVRYIEEMNGQSPMNMSKVEEPHIHKKRQVISERKMKFDSQSILFQNGRTDSVRGIPQGLNTSPILSILSLCHANEYFHSKGIKLTMYADDGFLHSNAPFDPKGSLINQGKSRGIKKNGEWLVPNFKFLGIEYDTALDIISGKTRNGSILTFDTLRMGLFDLIRELKKLEPKYESNLQLLANSGIFGTIQSKLYNNSGDTSENSEKPGKIVKGSLGDKLKKKTRNPLSGPASIGYLLPLVRGSVSNNLPKILKRKGVLKNTFNDITYKKGGSIDDFMLSTYVPILHETTGMSIIERDNFRDQAGGI